jgi:hypothetical protein
MSAGTHTAVAAAVMDRLSGAGLGEAALPGWWRTPRWELGGLAPEDALPLAGHHVLDLAEDDASRFRRDFNEEGSTV